MPIISEQTFTHLMERFEMPMAKTLAVGVSGGADSLCLALLLKKWCDKKNITLIALTVNHNLRPESKKEAKQVAIQMASHHIEHHILNWIGPKPITRIEERARTARYDLMQTFCKANNIDYLFLAHHETDQAETFFLRLSHASGVDGLSAMHFVSKRGELSIVRPLLNVSKTNIIDTLKAHEQTWIEDPMNNNPVFERVKWRQNLKVLEQMGLCVKNLTTTTRRLQRARTALEYYTHQFIETHVFVDNRGFARIDTPPFEQIPTDIQLRVFAFLLNLIGQSDKPLSMDSLEKALDRFPCQMTLGECHIIPHKTTFFIAKESARQPDSIKVPPCQWTFWDRFWVWSDVPAVIKASPPQVREKKIPYLVQCSFPKLIFQKKLEKIPTLDYKERNTYINSYIQFTPKNKG